ncbi:hypothetical protein ACQJBY_041246 [Aegilops geniculata]
MAALAQAPSPAESIDPPTRDHRQSVTSGDGTGRGMVYNLAYLELRKRAPWSLSGGLHVLHDLEELGSFSSDKTSEISKSDRSDEEFIMVGSTFRMDPDNSVQTRRGSAKSDLLSVGLILYTLVTRDHKIINDGETSLSLNAATETPIHHRPEGGLVYSGGPSHPAAAEESGTTPLAKNPEPAWLVASSAANHMTGDVSQLTDCTPAPSDLVVQVPNMGSRRVHNIGWLRTATMSLQDVYYVPGLDKNLVSSSQLAKLGYTITLGPSECRVTKNDQGQTLVGKAHFTDDYLFELDFLRVPPSTN